MPYYKHERNVNEIVEANGLTSRLLIPIYGLNIGRRQAGDDRSVQQSQNTRNLYDLHNQILLNSWMTETVYKMVY